MRNRELDCEIATKIFGWKWITFCGDIAVLMQPWEYEEHIKQSWSWKDGIAEGADKDFEGYHFIDSSHTPINRYPAVPYYSSDISLAWLVVEEMMKKNFPFELGDSNGEYYAMFWGEMDNPVYGKSMPECICKAALKALEGDY